LKLGYAVIPVRYRKLLRWSLRGS